MKPITVHLELEFDSASIEPHPWWMPYWRWDVGRYDDIAGDRFHLIWRIALLGFHLCIAIHCYDDELT